MEPVSDGVSDETQWFEELYRATYDDVLRYAARRVGRDAAADVAAEVFTTAWRRRADYAHDSARLWVFGVARRTVANAIRAQDRADRLSAVLRANAPVATSDLVASEAAAAHVLEALDQLSATDREVLLLVEWDRFTIAEAAAILGCSPPTLRVRLHRARRRIARRVARPSAAVAREELAR